MTEGVESKASKCRGVFRDVSYLRANSSLFISVLLVLLMYLLLSCAGSFNGIRGTSYVVVAFL